MLFQTTILPRRDGKVNFDVPNGPKLVFAPNENGDLVCDVTNENSIKALLNNQFFIPYSEDDIEAIGNFMSSFSSELENVGGSEDGDDGGDEEPDGGDDEVLLNAPPLEANTPPKRFKAGKAKAQ